MTSSSAFPLLSDWQIPAYLSTINNVRTVTTDGTLTDPLLCAQLCIFHSRTPSHLKLTRTLWHLCSLTAVGCRAGRLWSKVPDPHSTPPGWAPYPDAKGPFEDLVQHHCLWCLIPELFSLLLPHISSGIVIFFNIHIHHIRLHHSILFI